MNERQLLRSAILVFWTLFWGLSVADKVIPDVQFLWVGKDFFALFIKFFASLGLKDPLFATAALAGVSGLEAITFVLHLTDRNAMDVPLVEDRLDFLLSSLLDHGQHPRVGSQVAHEPGVMPQRVQVQYCPVRSRHA